jgi:hypothetical protein
MEGLEMQDVFSLAQGKIAILILLTGGISFFHYLVPTDQHTRHIIHIVLRKLYFLPPVIAAAWYGLRGAVYVTLAISVLFSFHAILDWPENYMEQANQGGELVSFWVAGLVAGQLFERERSLLKDLVRAHEETLLGLVSALDRKNTLLTFTHSESGRIRFSWPTSLVSLRPGRGPSVLVRSCMMWGRLRCPTPFC